MDASIEYAVSALRIPHIVICGHSGCGAMAGAMNPEGLEGLPHVKDWLSFSRAAVDIVKSIGADKSPAEQMDMLIEQNVLLQIQHLKTHPSVAIALAEKRTEIHGWVYNIGTGGVTAYDEAQDKFVLVDERYAEAAARYAGAGH